MAGLINIVRSAAVAIVQAISSTGPESQDANKAPPRFTPPIFSRVKDAIPHRTAGDKLKLSASHNLTHSLVDALKAFDDHNKQYKAATSHDNPHFAEDIGSLAQLINHLFSGHLETPPELAQLAEDWPVAVILILKYRELHRLLPKDKQFTDPYFDSLKECTLKGDLGVSMNALHANARDLFQELLDRHLQDCTTPAVFETQLVVADWITTKRWNPGSGYSSQELLPRNRWEAHWKYHINSDISFAGRLLSGTVLPNLDHVPEARLSPLAQVLLEVCTSCFPHLESRKLDQAIQLLLGVACICLRCNNRKPFQNTDSIIRPFGVISASHYVFKDDKRVVSWAVATLQFTPQDVSADLARQIRLKLAQPLVNRLLQNQSHFELFIERISDKKLVSQAQPFIQAAFAELNENQKLKIVQTLPSDPLYQPIVLDFVSMSRASQKELVAIIDKIDWGETADDLIRPLNAFLSIKNLKPVSLFTFLHFCPKYAKSLSEKVEPAKLDSLIGETVVQLVQNPSSCVAYESDVYKKVSGSEKKAGEENQLWLAAKLLVKHVAQAAVKSRRSDQFASLQKLLDWLPFYREPSVPLVVLEVTSAVAQVCLEQLRTKEPLPQGLHKLRNYRNSAHLRALFPAEHAHYYALIDKIHSKLKTFTDRTWTIIPRSELDWLRAHRDVLRSYRDGGFSLEEEDYAAAINTYDQLDTTFQDNHRLIVWLRTEGLIAAPVAEEEVKFGDDTYLTRVQLVDQLNEVNLDKEQRNLVIYLVTNNSFVFKAMVKSIQQQEKKPQVQDVLVQALKNTNALLSKSTDSSKLTLDDFKQIAQLQKGRRGAYKKELEILAKYMQQHNTGADTNAVEHLMEVTFEFTEYHSALKESPIFTVWEDHKLFAVEQKRLKAIISDVTGATTLAVAGEKLRELKAIFGPEFQPFQLEGLEKLLKDGNKVLEFLASKHRGGNFNALISRLTAELQSYNAGQQLLNIIIELYKLSTSLLDLKAGAAVSLKDVCSRIAQFHRTPESIKLLLETIALAAQRLHEIRTLFELGGTLRVETMAPYLKPMCASGVYTSYGLLSKSAPRITLHYDENDRPGATKDVTELLLEFVIAMEAFVSKGDDKASRKKKALSQSALAGSGEVPEASANDHQQFVPVFVGCYHEMIKIHQLHLELEQAGFPGVKAEIEMPKGLDIAKYKAQVKKMEDDKQGWLRDLEEQTSRTPRLRFLSDRQMAVYVRTFGAMIDAKRLKPASPIDGTPLLPYVALVFPDVDNATAICKELLSNLKSIDTFGKDEKSILTESAKLIAAIDDQLGAPKVAGKNDTTVLRALSNENIDPTGLFQLMYESNDNQIPSPSNVLWCTLRTSERDVENFINRAKPASQLPGRFFLVGVNHLDSNVKRKLSRHIVDLQNDRAHTNVPIFLIFTSNVGMDMYSWLPQTQRTADELDKSLPRNLGTANKIANLKVSVAVLEVYQGDPGCGKSFLIGRKLDADLAAGRYTAGGRRKVSINEDWSVGSFLKWFQKLSASDLAKGVGVHFNVSAYANYEMVNSFFSNLLYFGLIIDQLTGDCAFVPPTLKWYIYVELSFAPALDSEFRQVSTVNQVFATLPTLLFSGKRLVNPPNPIVFADDSWRRALQLAKCWMATKFYVAPEHRPKGNHQVPPKAEDSRPLVNFAAGTPEEAKEIFEALKKFLREKMHLTIEPATPNQIAFLNRFSQRCDWIFAKAKANAVNSREAGGDIPEHIFQLHAVIQQFLRESVSFSQKRISLQAHTNTAMSSRFASASHTVELSFISPSGKLEGFDGSLAEYNDFGGQDQNSGGPLRQRTSRGIGLENTADMALAVDKSKFILIPDFSYKLHLLSEHRDARQNLIMSGGTGVGKTQLLDFFASAKNISASKLLIFEVMTSLRQIIEGLINEVPSIVPGKPVSLRQRFKEYSTEIGKLISVAPESQIEDFVKILTELCSEPTLIIQKAPAAPGAAVTYLVNEGDLYFAAVSKKLLEAARAIVEAFPLLARKDAVDRLLSYRPDPKEPQNLVKDPRALGDFIAQLLRSPFADVFNRILMHKGVTAVQFKHTIRRIQNKQYKAHQKLKAAAEKFGQPEPCPPTFVVFIDEYNTTSIMGLVKEVLCDKTMEGEPLSPHLFFLAAMNPYEPPIEAGTKSFTQRTDYTGAKQIGLKYAVRPSHPSLEAIVVDFGNYETWQEQQFVASLLSTKAETQEYSRELSAMFANLILKCQDFLRCSQLTNIEVSIRDVMRAVKLFEFFHNTDTGGQLIDFNKLGGRHKDARWWRSVVIALSVTYYARLPAAASVASAGELATKLGLTSTSTSAPSIDALEALADKALAALSQAKVVSNDKPKVGDDSAVAVLLFVLDRLLRLSLSQSPLSWVHRFKTLAQRDTYTELESLIKSNPADYGCFIPLLRASKSYPAFGSEESFRLWAVLSLQSGTLQEQLGRLGWKSLLSGPTTSTTIALVEKILGQLSGVKASFDVEFDFRRLFNQILDPLLSDCLRKREAAPNDIVTSKVKINRENPLFTTVINECASSLVERAAIPPGIAKTEALCSNFFAIVTCISDKVPLTILGPAGCSKTLSFVLADENMKGEQSQADLFKKFKQVHTFRYQCSPYSSDTQVKATFENAIERQRLFDKHTESDSKDKSTDICCVMIDEAGLPPDQAQPLKVLHYYTEHPVVASVIITNSILDAAKTNRTALLQLPNLPPSHDLKRLANAALFSSTADGDYSESEAIVRGLCEAFQKTNLALKLPKDNFFQQRDFVYLLRKIRSNMLAAHATQPTAKQVTNALKRNFGGLQHDQFIDLVKLFFACVNEQLKSVKMAKSQPQWEVTEELNHDATLESLLDSLTDTTTAANANSSIAPWRYAAIIDPTDSGAAVSLVLRRLKELNKINSVRVCTVSDFAGDNTAANRSSIIAEIREAMEEGLIVLFINSGPLRTNFYDVFNRYFSRTPNTDEDSSERAFQEWANVAIGTQSRPCVVHPNFKFLVHIPKSELPDCPLPFLDRYALANHLYQPIPPKYVLFSKQASMLTIFGHSFEKYYVSPHHILETELGKLRTAQGSLLVSRASGRREKVSEAELIFEGIRHAVKTFHTDMCKGNLLASVDEIETVATLMLSILDDTKAAGLDGTTKLIIAPPIQDVTKAEDAEAVEDYLQAMDDKEAGLMSPTKSFRASTRSTTIEAKLTAAIRAATIRLFQLARPACFFDLRKPQLSTESIISYLVQQEHFNLMRFLQNAIFNCFFNDNEKPTILPLDKAHTHRKLCVYTRNCGQLLQATSAQVQRLLKQWMRERIIDDCVGLDEDSLHTLVLGEARNLTAEESTRFVKSFAEQCTQAKPGILLCVADMHSTTPTQVNWIRDAIDAYCISEHSLSILVLHYPPETQFSNSKRYTALYLNRWENVYVDSLGLAEGTSNETNLKIELDGRPWILWAFGIRLKDMSVKRITEMMEEKFWELLKHYCYNAVYPVPNARLQLARQDYLSIGSQAENGKRRFERLQELLQTHKFLIEGFLSSYTRSWTMHLSHQVVSAICQAIQKGEVVGSFVRVLQLAMRQYLAPLVTRTFTHLLGYFNLESVRRVLALGPDSEEFQLIELVAKAVEMPTAGIDFANTIVTNSSPFLPRKAILARLPYYYHLADLLGHQFAAVRATSKSDTNNFDTVSAVIGRFDSKKSPIGHALSLIDDSEELTELFIEDFLRCTLQLQLEGLVLKLAKRLVWKCNKDERGVVRIMMIKYVHSKKFNLFQNMADTVQPLLANLDTPDDTYVEMIRDSEEATITNALTLLTIDALIATLRKAIADNNAELLGDWCRAFRHLRASVPSRFGLLQALRTKVATFDAMSAIAAYLVNFLIEAKDALVDLADPGVSAALDAMDLSLRFDRADPPDFFSVEALLSVAFALSNAYAKRLALPPAKDPSPQLVSLIEDIFQFYFLDQVGEINDDPPSHIERTIRFFLGFFVPAQHQPLAVSNLPAGVILRGCLSASFRMNLLLEWFQSAPWVWQGRALTLAVQLIEEIKGARRYQFDPNILLGTDAPLAEELAKLQNPPIPALAKKTAAAPASPSPELPRHAEEDLRELDLERALYLILLKEQNSSNKQVPDLASDYRRLKQSNLPPIVYTLQQAAIATAILDAVARTLKTNKAAVLGWDAEVMGVVHTILGAKKDAPIHSPDGAIRNAKVYLLAKCGVGELLTLLRSEQILDHLQLPKTWLLTEAVLSNLQMNKMPFMVDQTNGLGKFYRTIAAAVGSNNAQTLATALAPLNTPQTRNPLRMFTVLAIYHEWFLGRKGPCTVLQQQPALLAPLQFTPDELKAVNFLIRGPVSIPNRNAEPVARFFSKEMIEAGSTELADIMVTVLAVALGSPSTSNHLYARIFNPRHFDPCPGADSSNRTPWDCYFQTMDDNSMTNYASVLGNNTRCRAALNSLTWAAWSWPLLLNPTDNALATYWSSTPPHFINTIGTTNNVEAVRREVGQKLLTFRGLLESTPEVAQKNIQAAHYLIESLFLLWSDCVNLKPGSPLKNPVSVPECIAYEEQLRKYFDQTFQNYGQLRTDYIAKSGVQAPIIKTVLQVQTSLSKRLALPSVGFEVASSGTTAEFAAQHPFYAQFLQSMPGFRVLKDIPRLVFFYELLLKTFGNRLTREQCQQPVLKCLDLIKNHESETTIRAFKKEWDQFKQRWANLRTELGNLLPVCREQAEQRAFEGEIIVVDDTTLLSALITESLVDSVDAILRVLESIQLQHKLIESRVKGPNDGYKNLNVNELLFENEPPHLRVSQLPTGASNPNANRYFFGCDWTKKNWRGFFDIHSIFKTSNDSLRNGFLAESLRVNYQRIERQMLEKSACKGDILLRDGEYNFRVEFPFLKEDLFKSTDAADLSLLSRQQALARDQSAASQANPDISRDSAESIQIHFDMLILNYWLEPGRFNEQGKFAARLHEDKRKAYIEGLHSRCDPEGLQEVASILVQIIDFLRGRDADGRMRSEKFAPAKDTFHTVEAHMGLNFDRSLSCRNIWALIGKQQLQFLQEICLSITAAYFEKCYLFDTTPTEMRNQATPDVAAALRELERLIYTANPDEQARLQGAISDIIAALSEIQVMKDISLQIDDNQPLQSLPRLQQAIRDADRLKLVPLPITGQFYAVFMRKLHSLCGWVAIETQKRRQPASATAGQALTEQDIYQEHLPSNIGRSNLQKEKPIQVPQKPADADSSDALDAELPTEATEALNIGAGDWSDSTSGDEEESELEEAVYPSVDRALVPPPPVGASLTDILDFLKNLAKVKPASTKPRGLANTSALCFANSVVQCLFAIPPLQTYYLRCQSRFPELSELAKGLYHPQLSISRSSINSAFTDNFDAADDPMADSILSSSKLCDSMSAAFKEYNSFVQCDAHEFLLRLIEHKIEKEPTVFELFHCLMTNNLQCPKGHRSNNEEKQSSILSVDLTFDEATRADLNSLLAANLNETLKWPHTAKDNSECSPYDCTKRLLFKTLPPVLILHLKRFQQDSIQQNVYVKDQCAVSCQEELTLAVSSVVSPLADPDTPTTYALVALCMHVSGEMHHGHYKALVRSAGQWSEFDDLRAQPATLPESSSDAYLMVYIRKDIWDLSGPAPPGPAEGGPDPAVPSAASSAAPPPSGEKSQNSASLATTSNELPAVLEVPDAADPLTAVPAPDASPAVVPAEQPSAATPPPPTPQLAAPAQTTSPLETPAAQPASPSPSTRPIPVPEDLGASVPPASTQSPPPSPQSPISTPPPAAAASASPPATPPQLSASTPALTSSQIAARVRKFKVRQFRLEDVSILFPESTAPASAKEFISAGANARRRAAATNSLPTVEALIQAASMLFKINVTAVFDGTLEEIRDDDVLSEVSADQVLVVITAEEEAKIFA